MSDAQKPELRWHRRKLSWVLFALLAVDGFLLVSKQLGWFGFRENGVMTAAIAVVSVLVSVLVMLFSIILELFRTTVRLLSRVWSGGNTTPFQPPRWYRLTPDRFVIGLLVVEGLLLLSEHFQRFGFDSHNDWANVFIKLAVVGAMIVLMLLWFVAGLLFRLRFQFSIRSLLVLVIAIAIPCSWIAVKLQQAERQRSGIALVQRLGGDAHEETRLPDLLDSLHRLMPDVFFDEIRFVEFNSKTNVISVADLNELVRLLPQINILYLKSTRITDADLETLSGLRELSYLDLSDTRITDAGLEHLTSLKHLRALGLDNTPVTDAGLAHLTGHELYALRLNGTQVTDAGLTHIHGHKLRELSLNNTRVSDAGLAEVGQQKDLQVVLLSGTMITDAGLDRLKGLNEPRQLDLSRTKVTDDGIKRLEGVTTLMDLNLSGTLVTDKGLESLKGLAELQQLNLADTKVTDCGLEHLAALKPDGLELPAKLSLVGTKTTKAGVKKLQQAWPNCTIER